LSKRYGRGSKKKASDERVLHIQKAITDGQLQRGSCEICGDSQTDGHHDDYSKPLFVRWLCSKHHLQWQREHPEMVIPHDPEMKTPKMFRLTPGTVRKLKDAARKAGRSESVYVEDALKGQFRKDPIE
jgi:hypothetical protein